jgi:hypothetical protein
MRRRKYAAASVECDKPKETGMSERARQFVEAWIRQFVRPERAEHPLHLFESRADAIACVHSALAVGISRLDIREEFADLVFHIAAARDRMAAVALPEKEKRPAISEPPSSGRTSPWNGAG